jgi:dephospho-CoA kinase
MTKEKIVVGVAGMPGSGKATIRRMVERMGNVAVVMGDEVREEAIRKGLKPTPENLGMIMLRLRKEEGPAVVAERCIPKIEKAKSKVVIVDGIRSLHEVEAFKRHFPSFALIAIHSSPEARFKRLFRRRRSDDPKNWKTFMERDSRELGVGLGSVIATADYMIVNEGTKSQLKRDVREFLEGVIRGG